MASIEVLSEKTIEATQMLSERISAKQWSDFSRTSFVFNTTQTINALEDIAVLFEEIGVEIEKDGFSEKIEVGGHLREINALILILQRNNDLESGKIQRAREKGIEMLAENVISPDQYSSLEQQVLGSLLKSRYLLERINIHNRKENSIPFMGSKSTKDVLDLLNEKENELQSIKEKYEKLKNTGLIARVAEKNYF